MGASRIRLIQASIPMEGVGKIGAFEAPERGSGPRLFDNWIKKQQLAEHLGVSISFINKVMTQGLPCRHIGRAVRFRISDVETWLTRRNV